MQTPTMAANTKYQTYKWTNFISMYAGYTMYILDRKAFSFVAPSIMKETGMSKSDLGLIASSQNMAYAISKFLGGLASDHVPPKALFCTGLFLTGLVTLAFPLFESVKIYAFLWFLSGLFQGGGWPAMGRVLRQWFHKSEVGTWWSIMSTAMNVACSVGPLVTTMLLSSIGWRGAMQAFGTVSIAMMGVCLVAMVNSPEEVGITGIETMASSGKDDKAKGKTKGRGTFNDLLKSPLMWVLCAGYLVVFCIRTAVLDWAQLYLIQDCNLPQYTGSFFLSSLETGGIVGSILAGYLGDKMVAMVRRDDTRGTPRMWVMQGFLLILISMLTAMLYTISENTSQLWIATVGALMGCSIYGPISLYGVMAMESAPSHLSGTSHATAALAANVGAILAGLPFSYLAQHFEWSGAFLVLDVLIIGVLIMNLLTRNMEYKMIPIRKKLE